MLQLFNKFFKKNGVRYYNTEIDIKDLRKINKENFLNEDLKDFSLVKGSYEYLNSIAKFRNLKWNDRESKDWLHFKLGFLKNKKIFEKNLKLFLNKLQPHQSYTIVFDCINNKGETVSLDKSYLVNYDTDPELLLIAIKRYLDNKAFKYGLDLYSSISVRYSGISKKVENLTLADINTPETRRILAKKDINHRFLSNKYVPFTMNYGLNSSITDNYINEFNEKVIVYEYQKKYLHVIKNEETLENKVEIFDKNNKLIDWFVDSEFDGYFIRQVDDLFIKMSNEDILYLETLISVKFNTKNILTKKDYIFNDKILTFDLETFSNNCIPYACGFYDGKNSYIYYLTNYNSIEDMVIDCFKGMLTFNYNNYTVYIHNLGKFDGTIIYKILLEYFDIKPLSSNKDQVYSYEIKNISSSLLDDKNNKSKTKKITKLILKDSKKILPGSLRNLGKSFNVETLKGIFPYKYVNEFNIDYIGKKPNIFYYELKDLINNNYEELKYEFNNKIMFDLDLIKSNVVLPYNLNKYYEFNEKDFPEKYYFNESKLALLEYKKIKNTYDWDLKEETTKYLKDDLISLYQILIKYISQIHKDHKINVVNSISIPSLSSKIYYTDYYKDEYKLPILTGEIESCHRKAFFGGLSDVIKPYANKNIKSYDFVSMYPGIMNEYPFPTGSPIFTTNKNLDELFGIFYAKVKIPPLYIPMLPYKENNVVMCPTGEWEWWYTSIDLQTIKSYGCEVEVMYGYNYEKTYGIYSDFITEKFEIKNNSVGAAREIAKLNMNSLFGFGGRHNYNQVVKFVTKEEKDKIECIYQVFDYFYIERLDKYHIRYSSIPDPIKCKQSGENYEDLLLEANKKRFDLKQVSLPAACFISAYGRRKLSEVIQGNINNILNYDTDGLKIMKQIKGSFMGNALGQLKEDIKNITEYIGVAPKFYCLTLKNGKQIFKGKSIKNENLNYKDYLNLYNEKNILKNETRWYSKLNAGRVEIRDLPIEISHNLTKREKIYSLGKWIDTRPFCIKDGKIISTALVKVNTNLILYKKIKTSIVLFQMK